MGVRTSFCSVVLYVLLSAYPAYGMRVDPPHEYGRVVINNHSTKAGLPPVVFEHWLHRAMFTCRFCHVDVGFAMEGGATKIRASTNRDGFHCGACHNGKTIHEGKKIFAACTDNISGEEQGRCARCHSEVNTAKSERKFNEFIEGLPKRGAGNGVDWEEAEKKGLIQSVDFLEGVSIRRTPLKMGMEIAIESRGTWMSDVVFSHKKHSLWNGCEVCHPEIFPSTKKGEVKFSMYQISNGEYCGVCHVKVAFPLVECQRCHLKPLR